ncbi:MAG: stage III sporulation protein AD [Bacillota bacterium]|nr:stage III sporulation protein AD [Bacillota bacterium]HHU60421.1 stage III sporulation protein AD [Natronincola sp.]
MLLWLPLVIGLGLVLTVFQSQLREEQPSWAVLLSMAFVVIVLGSLLTHFSTALQTLTVLAREASVSSLYLNPVLKTIGVAYITSFGVEVCREAGEEAISKVVELAGKLVILLIALPVLQAILHILFGILGF